MKLSKNKTANKEHLASAKANDLPVSTKHSVEICRHLRFKTTNAAKKILENTISLKAPIPFKRFKNNIGHKPGMAAGRFPQKAAREVLKLIKTVETNAQFKGLNTSSLKISKMLANKASIPLTGGRHRGATKRTNLEIEVIEAKEKKKKQEANKKETKEKKETKKIKPNEALPNKQIEEPAGEQKK